MWIVGFVAAFSTLGWAATPPGATFLQIDPSARGSALGATSITAATGAQALGANPANLLSSPERYEVFAAYSNLLDGAQYGHVAFMENKIDALGLDGLGFSISQLDVGGMTQTDADGNKIGAFSGGDLTMSLAGAKRFSALAVGATLKGFQSQLALYHSDFSVAADLGVAYTLSRSHRNLIIDASVNNLGPGLRFTRQLDPLPTAISLGSALAMGPYLMVAQISRPVYENGVDVGAGIEYEVLRTIAFRVGYTARSGAADLAASDQGWAARTLGGLVMGMGVQVSGVRLDYAVGQQAADYAMTHRVGLTVGWGARRFDADDEPFNNSDRLFLIK